MTILQALQQINLYPIPDSVIMNYCEERGLQSGTETTLDIRKSDSFKLATADVYKWLAFAPATVSQGGVSFSLSENDKKKFLDFANDIYKGINEKTTGIVYGYKGSRL